MFVHDGAFEPVGTGSEGVTPFRNSVDVGGFHEFGVGGGRVDFGEGVHVVDEGHVYDDVNVFEGCGEGGFVGKGRGALDGDRFTARRCGVFGPDGVGVNGHVTRELADPSYDGLTVLGGGRLGRGFQTVVSFGNRVAKFVCEGFLVEEWCEVA